MKKKILALFMVMIIMMMGVVACGSGDSSVEPTVTPTQALENVVTKTPVEPVDINIAVMTGPTAIGLTKVMSDAEKGTALNNYHFNVYGTADEVATGLIKGDLDVACVPSNLASILYNKTEGDIVVAAINTLGVLYLVEEGNTIHGVEDLIGKTIYSTGQGTTPEYTLRYLLSLYDIDPDNDVTIEYKSEAAEVTAILAETKGAVAMLPQPYVTAAMNQNENLRIALSVTEEWEKLSDNSTVVTGVLAARKSFVEENKDAFEVFLGEYALSTVYANGEIEETANLLEHFNIFKAAIAKKAIPYCNVIFIEGETMETLLSSYLQVLYDQNPASIGGKMPEADFYYYTEQHKSYPVMPISSSSDSE